MTKENQELQEIISKELQGLADIELLILKGHILIEYALNKYINETNDGNINIEKQNFSFNNKILVAELLGLFRSNVSLKKFIININKLRNKIAHKLIYEKNLIKEIVADYKKLDPKAKNNSDEENFYLLVNMCCGLIMGSKDAKKKIKIFTNLKLGEMRKENPEKFDQEFKNYKKQ